MLFAKVLCLSLFPALVLSATFPSGFTSSQVAGGLDSPTAMSFAPDGRLFVCEQNGRLRVIRNDTLLSAPFLAVNVNSDGERGLLGVTFDPNFGTNQYVYVYYTAQTPNVHNRISRFTANGDVAIPGSELQILNLNDLSSATNHNGGSLHFGQDGKLYIAVGENANPPNSQTLGNMLGKMLRINPDGTIPTDNPFYNTATGNNRSIWALGLRNPFTFAVQPGTSRLFINDVGQENWEEINDGMAGANYGWPATEGYTSNPDYRGPIHAYGHGDGCAITGGTFYNPSTVQFPASYLGNYFFADFCTGWIRRFRPSDSTVTSFGNGVNSPVDVQVSQAGSLYYLARNSGGTTGTVSKVQYTATLAPGITVHPSDVTVSAGQPATFSVSSSGAAPFSYQWKRDSVTIPGAVSRDYTIGTTQVSDSGARFHCVVSNAFGSATSNQARLTVTSNRAPAGTIMLPADSMLFSAGDTVQYSGAGTDPEDGVLGPGAFTWRVDFHHDTHSHPFIPATSGAQSGSFIIPTIGETSDNVWYRIHLAVVDNGGLVDTTFRDIFPRKSIDTISTIPAGLQITLDGQPHMAPNVFVGVVGVVRSIQAVSPQLFNGSTYTFVSWSDGGAATHTISTPLINTNYRATYSINPSIPTLASPADNATNRPASETLRWNVSSGAVTYRLQVATDSIFGNLVVNDSALVDTFRIVVLSNQTKYYWRVRAGNAGGGSAYSSVWSFTTVIAAPLPPGLNSPANSSLNQSTSPTLVWNRVSGADTYRLQLGTDSSFTGGVVLDDSILTDTSHMVTGLSNSTKYHWRVSSRNIGGTSGYSTTWNFTTIAMAPPAPILVSPVDGSVNQPTFSTLQWAPASGATSYRLQVGTDPGFVVGIILDDSTLTDTSYGMGGLNNDATYYWRVNGGNIGGTGSYSDIWAFTTITADPSIPALVSPLNGSVHQSTSPAFQWLPASGATTYRLQVVTDSSFVGGSVFDDSTLTDTSRVVTGLSNGTKYHWRVSAGNIGGTDSYSSIWNFTTIVAAPSTPVLVSPPNGSTNQSASPALRWASVSGATVYRLQMGTDPGFLTGLVLHDSTLTDTSRIVNGLTAGATYYWRASAENVGGTSSWSAVWNFTTAAVVAPSAPALASPLNGSVNQPASLALQWSPASGAATYRLQVATDSGFASGVVLDDSTVTDTSRILSGLNNDETYYWRLNAENIGGTSGYSATWNFTTIMVAPPVPALVSPLNGSVNQPTSSMLLWAHTSGATSYRLQVATDSSFADGVVLDDSTLTDTSRTIGGLSNDETYYWRLRAKNIGGTSAYSMVWSFTTITTAPSVPILISPANASANQPTSPSLRWSPASGATSYRLQVGTDFGFVVGVILDDSTLTDTSRTINGLSNNGTYYWRLRAKNNGGTSGYSTIWNFTTIMAAPPVPALVSPLNGSVNQPTSSMLLWAHTSGATSYRLQVATDSSFADGVVLDDSTLTDTSRTMSGLSNDETYYWRLRAKNIGGTSAYSMVWSFTTITTAPSVPILISPANASANQSTSPSLRWSPASGAASYRLQVGTDFGFVVGVILDDSTLTDTSRTINGLSNNGTYYWRLRAKNNGGTSGYSTIWNFTTIMAAPSVPALVTPVNGSVNQPASSTLQWAHTSGATSYRLQVATDSSFADGVVLDDSTLTDTSRTMSGLSNDETYYWRLRAKNIGGTSAYSMVWNFTTITTAPSVPALVSPLNGAVNQSTSPTLFWAPASGATAYRLQFGTDSSFAFGLVLDDSTLADTSRPLNGLNLNNFTTYFWRVNAGNVGGTSGYSTTWNFTTITAAPSVPALISPLNTALNQSTSPTFEWAPSSGATTYRLQVGTDSGFIGGVVLDDSTIASTSRTISGLDNNTTYYWRVNAQNTGGVSGYSTIWNFATIVGAPGTPSLLTPANGATINADSVITAWLSTVQATDFYWFEHATDSLFTAPVIDSTITDTTYIIRSLVTDQAYWWRARAHNASGWGPFSEQRAFTVTITGIANDPGFPQEFSLAQNYPNPFNPSTTIRFGLPRNSHVTLKVYDLLGREVVTLVDKSMPAGYHAVNFDAGELSSSIYFCRIQAGDLTALRKMLLLK